MPTAKSQTSLKVSLIQPRRLNVTFPVDMMVCAICAERIHETVFIRLQLRVMERPCGIGPRNRLYPDRLGGGPETPDSEFLMRSKFKHVRSLLSHPSLSRSRQQTFSLRPRFPESDSVWPFAILNPRLSSLVFSCHQSDLSRTE